MAFRCRCRSVTSTSRRSSGGSPTRSSAARCSRFSRRPRARGNRRRNLMPARSSRRLVLHVLLVFAVLLIGYHGLLGGAHFFNEEDANTLYDYAHGTAHGNGWRADKGLGISFFHG